MAKKTTAPVEQPAPAVEETEETERDYTALAAKPPSELSEHILAWIIEKAGVTFATAKEQAAFAKGVDLTIKFRTYHQASPENQERLEEAKERRATEKAAKAEAKAKADAESAEETAKPAKKGKAAPVEAVPEPEVAKPTAKKATPGKGKKAPF